MNYKELKKRAFSDIIKAMRQQAKHIGSIVEFNGSNVILSDTYTFIISPLNEISSKDRERINKVFKRDIFTNKEICHIARNKEYSSRSKFLSDFIDNQFLSEVYTLKLYEDNETDKVITYMNDKYVTCISQNYKNMIYYPKTYKSTRKHRLLLSIIDNITTGVLPLRSE